MLIKVNDEIYDRIVDLSQIEKRYPTGIIEDYGRVISITDEGLETETVVEVSAGVDTAITLIPESIMDLNYLRTKEVAKIVVTLADTVTILDGDEVSQGRMARAIAGLPDDITTTIWIGANGDVYSLTKPQFQEAISLAGEAQTAIWVNYATLKASF
jgi:hypothetical protein